MTTYSLMNDYAAQCPDAKLFGENGGWLTASQSAAAVTHTAATLRSIGVEPGDLVAVGADQSVRTALTVFALNALGSVAVLCDPRQRPEDAAEGMPIRFRIWEGCCTDCGTGIRTPLEPAALTQGELSQPWEDADSPAYIIFTSGSTGKQKPVTLSQNNLLWNMKEALPLGGYREGDLALGVLPMTHVFGLVLLVGTVAAPYGLYILDKKDPASLLEAIERQRLTRMNGVPSLYLAMARQCTGYDLSSLKFGFIGGGPCTPEQFAQIEQSLDMTLVPAYGMSECIGISSACWRDSQALRANGVGRFYPHTQGKILLEDGEEAAPGEEGEVCVHSPTRMLGYWGEAPDATGLLHTGDLGWVDGEGILHISGRKKDIIIRNGVNLMPLRIEKALLALPGVSAAVVVGIPDSAEGELPCAMVVSQEEHGRILEALSHIMNKNELPAKLLTVDSIPLTASGKPDRQAIREVLRQWTLPS